MLLVPRYVARLLAEWRSLFCSGRCSTFTAIGSLAGTVSSSASSSRSSICLEHRKTVPVPRMVPPWLPSPALLLARCDTLEVIPKVRHIYGQAYETAARPNLIPTPGPVLQPCPWL